MTERQIIKKLKKANYRMDVVVEASRDEVEVIVMDGEMADYDFSEAAADLAAEILGFSQMSMTGYGSWIVSNSPRYFDEQYCTQ